MGACAEVADVYDATLLVVAAEGLLRGALLLRGGAGARGGRGLPGARGGGGGALLFTADFFDLGFFGADALVHLDDLLVGLVEVFAGELAALHRAVGFFAEAQDHAGALAAEL